MQKIIVRRELVPDEHLSEQLHPKIKQIYASRGVASTRELELTLSALNDVNTLKDIDKACTVLHNALVNNNPIVIVGDFDADGATSTALMMEALTLLGSRNHTFMVPNRFAYGYGLTPEIVDLIDQSNVNQQTKADNLPILIITVDNGISCIEGVKRAKSLGMSVIITDHHLPGKTLPMADAIVNPNQAECHFASKSIAGVGVAFYFMLAMRKYLRDLHWFNEQLPEPNLAQLLDLVALGTVADVVSLDANNRILVDQGLKRIRAGQTRAGIQALIDISGRNQQTLVASDFGFALGPRINAAGRLDDMSFGINCLLAKDLSIARQMALELDGLNKSRREIEQGMQLEAEKILSQLNIDQNNLPNAIALFQQDWHQGVIGIVAGRIKEKFHRPSIVFALGKEYQEALDPEQQALSPAQNTLSPEHEVLSPDQEIKGSARSIPGLHIRDLLEHIDSQYPDLMIKFGGHAMAAGLSLKVKDFPRFHDILNQTAGMWLKQEDLTGVLLSDGSIDTQALNLSFAEIIRDAGPWGQNFPEPLFDDEFTLVQQRIVGEKHLKLVLQKDQQLFDAIAFNVDTQRWPNHNVQKVNCAFRLDINEFRGKRNLQLMVEHIQALEKSL